MVIFCHRNSLHGAPKAWKVTNASNKSSHNRSMTRAMHLTPLDNRWPLDLSQCRQVGFDVDGGLWAWTVISTTCVLQGLVLRLYGISSKHQLPLPTCRGGFLVTTTGKVTCPLLL